MSQTSPNKVTGINFNIFLRAITKYGDYVTHTPRTRVMSNIDGDETFTNGTSSNIKVYIVRKSRPWTFDKEGTIEGGEGVMLVQPTVTINRNDLIEWKDVTYFVERTLNRNQLGGNTAYIACNLFLYTND